MKSYTLTTVLLAVLGLTAAAAADTTFFDAMPPATGATAGPAEVQHAPGTPTGSIYLYVDPASGADYSSGGIAVSVDSSNPGVIAMTNVDVFEPTFSDGGQRWSSTFVNGLGPDDVDEIGGMALQTMGLVAPSEPDPGDPNQGANGNYAFARIDYDILGPGTTSLGLGPIAREGQFIVSNSESVPMEFDPADITVIPEPASLTVLGASGMLLLRRRRN
jgi:hypothetical protein